MAKICSPFGFVPNGSQLDTNINVPVRVSWLTFWSLLRSLPQPSHVAALRTDNRLCLAGRQTFVPELNGYAEYFLRNVRELLSRYFEACKRLKDRADRR